LISKLEIYAIVFVLIGLTGVGAYFYARHQGVMQERARWEAKEAAATKADLVSLTDAVNKGALIAQQTYEQVQKGKTAKVIDRGVIEREVRTDVRYSNDCFPDTGRLRWNSINAGKPIVPTEPAGPDAASKMPGAVGAGSLGLKRRDIAAKP
jgi:hypothetical protein